MRIGKQLADVIQACEPRRYHEPFCGVFSVGKHIVADQRTAADIHPDLILLLNALRDGWQPPTDISREEYTRLRESSPSALRGFTGFGCSFYGKFFQGYATDPRGYNFATTARKNLLKLAPMIQGVEFKRQDYKEYDGKADVIYCDPPYAGTADYRVGEFNPVEFWDWVRGRKETVIVSEYEAPDDFETIWEQPTVVRIRDRETGKCGKSVERLFRRLFTRK